MNLDEIQAVQDAGKRIYEAVTLHFLAATDKLDPVGKWCAFNLSDGRSDGVLYPSKDEAMRRQNSNPKNYCYMKLTPDGITEKDAVRFLVINRHPYIDTTAPEHVINKALYPRFSNLSPAERRKVKAEEKALNKRLRNGD